MGTIGSGTRSLGVVKSEVVCCENSTPLFRLADDSSIALSKLGNRGRDVIHNSDTFHQNIAGENPVNPIETMWGHSKYAKFVN